MNSIEEIIQQVLKGTITAPEAGGHYRPTLVVGLGGTGIKVLRFLKHYLAPHAINEIKLLGIDSDLTENGPDLRLPPLADSEMALLNADVAVRLLDRAAAKDEAAAHVLRYLPKSQGESKGLHTEVKGRIQIQRGAGQFRRAGKLLFCSNVAAGVNLEQRLSDLQEAMVGLQQTVNAVAHGLNIDPGTRLFVVSSIAGGQGSGALLDCLALLRKHFNQPQDQITAVLVLPGKLYDKRLQNPAGEKPQTRGNAIGSLRELQAAIQGQLEDHTFVFDPKNQFQPGASPLLNHAFLVDHSTFSRRQVKTDFELFEATGLFLYALIGSGVGAKNEAGAINAPATPIQEEAVPRLFKAFGIGILECPAAEILGYCLRRSLQTWIKTWTGSAYKRDEAANEATKFLTRLGISSLEEHRSRIRPEIPEAGFYEGVREEKALVSKGDSDFFAAVNFLRNRIDNELNRYAGQIDALKLQLDNQFAQDLEEQTRRWAVTGGSFAKDCLTELSQKLADHAAAQTQTVEGRSARIDKLNQEMEKKEKWIRRIPGPFDHGKARQYLKLFRGFLEEKVHAKLDQYLAQSLTSAANCAGSLASDVENLVRTMSNVATDNETAIKEIETGPPNTSFVQRTITGPQFKKWCDDHFATVPDTIQISALDVVHLLNAVLSPLLKDYQADLNQVNIVTDVRASRELKNRVEATEMAAEPLINLTNTGPSLEEMMPNKFVAAKLPKDGDAFLKENYKPLGQAQVSGISIDDPYRLICLQTVRGFGAAHWFNFASSDICYRQQEWRSHTLPDYENLEPLTRVTEERAQTLRLLGLALAFQLIHVRGSNHYRNLIFNDPQQKFFFEFYTEGPAAGAKALIDKALVVMPDKSKAKPIRNDPRLLGTSLEATVGALARSESLGFIQNIEELTQDFIALVGSQQAAQILNAFRSGPLDEMMVTTGREETGRLKLLRETSKALENYVTKLG